MTSQNLIFTEHAPTESRLQKKYDLGALHSLPARPWLQASRRLRIRDVTQVANDGSAGVPKPSYTGPEIATPAPELTGIVYEASTDSIYVTEASTNSIYRVTPPSA